MPWTAADAKRFKKGLTKEQAQKWAKIANSVLKQCLNDGGKQKSCEAKAIKVANSKVDGKNSNNNDEEVKGVKKQIKVPKEALYFSEDEPNIALSEAKEGEAPRFSMVAYSGKIIKGRSFWGDLAIDVSGIKFTQKRVPILEDHEWSKKLGVSNKLPSLDGNQISFSDIKLLSNDYAQEFKQNLDDGFPYQASISIRPTKIEELAEGASAEVNGYKMTGPGQIIRESTFREASACVFGADHRTSVKSLADQEEEIEVEVVSLSAEPNTPAPRKKNKKTPSGGKSMLDLTAIKEDHPDLVKDIEAALKAKDDEIASLSESKKGLEEQVTSLTKERDELKQKNENLTEEAKQTGERIAKLEKSEQIRKEKDLKQSADSIVDVELAAATDLPKRLYKRVKDQIDHNDFVEEKDGENVLDVEKFKAHVKAEITSWIEDLKDSETSQRILGLSGGGDNDNDQVDSDKLSDTLVSFVTNGKKPDEK